MLSRTYIATGVATLILSTAVIGFQQLPPNHPDLPLPKGHPPVQERPDAPADQAPPADPADVQTVDAIVSAYYDSISGPKGEPRQWDRFRSLFLPGARLMTMRASGPRNVPMVLSPEDYVASNSSYFEGGGYFEQELHRETDEFGNIAQVFSTYASRRNLNEPKPYSRGINSLQLLNDGQRWWIVTVTWDYERSKDNPIPAQYLPAADQ